MTDTLDPAGEYFQLWQLGPPPDLDVFLARAGDLAPDALAAVLRVDQRERWRTGEPVLAEAYLRRYPQVRAKPDAAVDLVYGEFLLREKHGSPPQRDEFLSRFPDLAESLRAQIELHAALAQPTDDVAATSAPTTLEPRGAPLPSISGQFGRYHILRELGKGGMGTVYLARDSQLDRLVALKVPRLDGGPEQARRFLREARAAAALEHPNICPLFDFGQIDGRCFLTMPYVEGESLAAQLRHGPLPVDEAVAIVRTLAGALEEAHRRGIVHRDLKPANVLRNSKGQPVITDFGLAKRLAPSVGASSETLTREGAIFGTPAYMAPEQVNGETDAIGPATDVYALGVVLYELLTGKPPYEGRLGAILAQVVADPPEPPSRRRPGLDPRLDAVCLKAMAKKPADRFATMSAFAAALNDVRKDSTTPGRTYGRPKWPIWSAAAVAVMVLALGLVLWRPWKPRTRGGANKPEPASPIVSVRDPAAALVLADRGWELNDRGDTDAAIRECGLALALDDRCVKALICRANAFIKKKDFNSALTDLDRAKMIDPLNPMAHIDRAWANNSRGNFEQAFQDAERAIQLKKDSAEAYYQRGSARGGLGKHREAVDDFNTAIRLDENYAWAYRERAMAYQALGEAVLAAKDQAKAAEIEALGPGTRWEGEFAFRHMNGSRGDVVLKITERSGDNLRGVYITEKGAYEWEIKGTVTGTRVRWGFVRAIRGEGAAALIGKATAEGTIRNGVMEVVFHDPNDSSTADLKLYLKR